MEWLEEQVVETTTTKINLFLQLSIPTYHNSRTDPSTTCNIFSLVKSTCMAVIKQGFFNLALGINQGNVQTYLEK